MKNHSLQWLVKTIKYGLLACFFMPLIVGGSFVFPYIFPKQALFQIVVEIVFALYLSLALRDPNYRPRSSWLLKLMVAYFAAMVLSSIFGVNTYHSFWSNYERMAGVISLFHYLGFLFVAANVFKTQKDWHAFFDFSIIASVIEAFYGLGQLAGIFASSGGVRIDGTIGNASFLAGYMLINAFFAFWLMFEKRDIYWKYFYAFTIFLNLFVMYETETRGAVLGLLAGLFALAAFFIFARKDDLAQSSFGHLENLKKYAVGFLVFCFVASIGIWLARDSAFVKSNSTLNRVTHISMTESTAQTRLLAWKMSLRGFMERPIFGWGPENYYVVFNKFYDPNLYPIESWFDRSHNAYLDILVNTGIIGSLIYLAIIFLVFWYLWVARCKEKISYFTAAIFSVIILAYGVQDIFVFDTQVTLLMFYSILAFIVFLSANSSQENFNVKPVKPNSFFKIFVLLILVFMLYFVNIKPGLASMDSIDALQVLQHSDMEESLAKFKASLDIGTFGLPEVAMRVQDVAAQLAQNNNIPADIKKKFTELAIDGMNRALEQEPLNVRYMMILSTTLVQSAESSNSYLAQADALLRRALELSPTRQELYFYIGQIRMYQGRSDEALAMFKKAVELNGKVAISHWNYGIIAIGVGRKDIGEKEIQIAKNLGHNFGPGDIKQAINAYSRSSDWPRIIVLYQEWINLTPSDAAPYAGLAAVYAQAGDKEKAKDLALQAAQLDPSYQAQSDQFIKGLGL